MICRSITVTAVVAAVLALAGCGRSPRVDFYTLEAAARSEAALPCRGPAVVVGPVTLPEVVDRPQLVVRSAANRVEILETQRWAEPLKSGIPRLIAQELGRDLGSSRVASYHQLAGTEAEYRVLLDILRFESVPGDAVTVEADWTIRRGGAAGSKTTGRSVKHEKVTAAGYDALVAALGRALAALGADIAAAIKAQENPQPPPAR